MRCRAWFSLWKSRSSSFSSTCILPPSLRPPLPSPFLPARSISSQSGNADSSKTTSTSDFQGVRRKCRVYNFTGGLIPYHQAWVWQQRLLHERMAWQREKAPDSSIGHDVLLLLQHSSVFTLGRGSTLDNLRFDPAAPDCRHEVRRTERGGEVTWHGPGQIVGYPVLDLNYHKKDLHWYLRQLEEVIIRVLAKYELEGERETEHTGVWVDGAKVAAIGLNASRWVTSHGFALNVDPELSAFKDIVPCGIQGRLVTRLSDLVPSVELDVGDEGTAGSSVRSHVLREFAHVFGLDVEIVEVDVASVYHRAEGNAPGQRLEDHLFGNEGDPKLMERLRVDGEKQLELTRRR